jgi:hypothetical protein
VVAPDREPGVRTIGVRMLAGWVTSVMTACCGALSMVLCQRR